MAACIAGAARGPKHDHSRGEYLGGCFGIVSGAMAGSHTGLLHRMSCGVVRYYVARYTASTAEQYARSKGATDADIEAARRYIKA
jgi:hypothetical protein